MQRVVPGRLTLALFSALLGVFLPSRVRALDVVLLGGGGEPAGASTIFDPALERLAGKIGPMSLNVRPAFDGGHSRTEDLLRKGYASPNIPFTQQNYRKLIDEQIERIRSGAIPAGGKLLVMIDTHGGERSSGLRTHPISLAGAEVSNYGTLAGSTMSSLDELSSLQDVARQKGVKLGIVDLSCHSGNSIALADDNTCVISASGPRHFAYNRFAEIFIDQLSSGKSLEQVFLDTRVRANYPSFPMISTRAGRKVAEEQYELIAPYLFTNSSRSDWDKASPYLRSVVEQGLDCQREQQFAELMAQIRQLRTVSGRGPDPLVDALQSYKADQDRCVTLLQRMGVQLLNQKEVIRYGSGPKDRSGHSSPLADTLTWRDILTAYPLSNRDYFLGLSRDPKTPAADRAEYRAVVEKFEKIDQKRQQILAQYPGLRDLDAVFDEFKSRSSEIFEKAGKISRLGNELYDERYRQLRNAGPQGAEPCRDFVL